jgi:signal transduction histidine kinase
VGALPLPRITLQQVFQNLVQNAAEAALDSSQERSRLRISCELVPTSEGSELLSFLFADDGVGIPEKDLTRIFENGYSTKSRATNQGIGLHWCANALQALGGSIRAEYRPRGGATFRVAIPLRRTGAAATAQAA